jgi:putative ABC transport system permease protein
MQRTKEIGIRKVLGASVPNILVLLSTDFLKLIFISLFIAIPVGWYVMHSWLQDFAYRINIHWWVFIIAAVIAILIAVFTIGTQAIKAALTNPIKSLRTE